MFQKSFYTFKALKKNMWTSGFFCVKCLFPLSNVHQIVYFNIFHKKGSMCSKHWENKNTYIILDFIAWMSSTLL
jgi:hypothetical protein